MTTTIIFFFIFFLVGAFTVYFFTKRSCEKLKSQITFLSSEKIILENTSSSIKIEKEQLNDEIRKYKTQISSLSADKIAVETELEVLEARHKMMIEQKDHELETFKENLNKIENGYLNRLKEERESFKSQIESERLHAKDMIDAANMQSLQYEKNAALRIEQNEKQWQIKFEKLKEELTNITLESLKSKQQDLQETNALQIGELLKPLREKFDAFQKSVDQSRTSNEVAKEELKNKFESTLKLFEQQQNQAVADLKAETAKIGNDAANLTRVLKRDSKAQGDWGEMILESLLESSGLEKDIHYFIQENVKDEDGKNFRPDVIVRFPEGRSVIIDSKVSLTAYSEAIIADDENIRKRKLKEHVISVRRHVDELSEKNYEDKVEDALGFTLMFIPNDQCFISAIEQDKSLFRYAYSKRVVIISPCNLMTTLHLAYSLWQQDRQFKNIDSIVKTATDLYDKAALVSKSIVDLGDQIAKLMATYTSAKRSLFDGNGNLFRRIEHLKDFGITPKKQISGIED